MIYWLLIGITAANYSFLTFAFSGEDDFASPLKPLAYARLPLAAIGFFYVSIIHKKGVKLGNVGAPIALFLVAILFTIPMSIDAQTAAIYAAWFAFQLLFLAKYAYYVSDTVGLHEAKLKLFIPIMVYGAYFLVLTIFRLNEYQIGKPFPAIYTTRVQVAMLAPLFLGVLACCYHELKIKQLYFWPLIGFTLFCIAVLLVSGKRASIVCVFLIVAAYFLLKTKVSGKLIVAMLAPVAIGVIYYTGFSDVALQASEYSIQRIEKGFDSRTATSINARLYIWDIIGEYANTHPFGVGLNVGRQLVGGGMHNTYLGYLLEAGWLSFIIFIALVIWSCQRAVFSRNSDKKDVFYFVMLPCLLYSVTEYNTSPGQPLFIPFWMGILFALLPTKRKIRNVSAK